MSNETVIDVLNELLAAESLSLLPRLRESTVFVSWASADDQQIVDRMIDGGREHQAWLIGVIRDLGGEPLPVRPDIHSGDIHFLELHYLLPRTLETERRLLTTYESAVHQASEVTPAASVIARIMERRRKYVEQLSRMTETVKPTAT